MQDFKAVCQNMLLQIHPSFAWKPVNYIEKGKNTLKSRSLSELKGKAVVFF